MKRYIKKAICIILLVISFSALSSEFYYASSETTASEQEMNDNLFGIDISTTGETGGITGALQIVLVLTVISLSPSILIMLTSFTRLIVVLHFTRAAIGTQTTPPNQVLIGLALFLTFFIMTPTITTVYEEAIKPLSSNEITQEEALERGVKPIRTFMLKQVKNEDLNAMLEIAKITEVEDENDIPTTVLIPAYILSELRIAFWIGFLIYIPFIVIDMVVASTLMSMGMMMLPPTTISAPFKILLFVLADGWNLIIVNLIKTFVT